MMDKEASETVPITFCCVVPLSEAEWARIGTNWFRAMKKLRKIFIAGNLFESKQILIWKSEKRSKKFILIYIQRGKTKQEKGDFPAMNLIKKLLLQKQEEIYRESLWGFRGKVMCWLWGKFSWKEESVEPRRSGGRFNKSFDKNILSSFCLVGSQEISVTGNWINYPETTFRDFFWTVKHVSNIFLIKQITNSKNHMFLKLR